MLHHIIPHPNNNFRAKLLHHQYLAFYILLMLFLQFTTPLIRRINPDILGYATNITIERIIQLVNAERAKVNAPPLSVSSELTNAAVQKGNDMIAKNYWAHISPTGATPWSFITGAGYNYIYAGENLAKSFNSSEEVVAAWLNSPTHRANILKPEYTEIGLAVINGQLLSEDTTLVVQEFGSRASGKPLIAKAEPAVIRPSPTEAPALIAEVAALPQEITVTPQPTITALAEKPRPVTARTESVAGKSFITILPQNLNRNISFIVTELLLIALFIDGIYIWRHRETRITGHSLAHMLFLAALLGAMSATGIGAIL